MKSVDEFKSKSWIKVIFVWKQSNSELTAYVNEKIALTTSFSGGIDSGLTIGATLEMSSSLHSKFL